RSRRFHFGGRKFYARAARRLPRGRAGTRILPGNHEYGRAEIWRGELCAIGRRPRRSDSVKQQAVFHLSAHAGPRRHLLQARTLVSRNASFSYALLISVSLPVMPCNRALAARSRPLPG